MSADILAPKRIAVATACRILGRHGLVDGILGHVSARVGPDRLLVRCRGPQEKGVARTLPDDIRLVDLEGRHLEESDGWEPPKELSIHTRLLTRRPDIGAVVHAHPPAVLVCGLAGLDIRPIFGAYGIPALHLAREGVPTYGRSVLIATTELADEMLAAMGDRRACVLRGHGITTVGDTVEQATLAALDLNQLCSVTLELARLGASPPEVPEEDLAQLPDLGRAFNDRMRWQALVAELGS